MDFDAKRADFVSPEDSLKYTVKAIPWIKKNALRSRFTKIVDVMQQKVEFDDQGFAKAMLLASCEKDGKQITEADLETLGPKTGDTLEQLVNVLNFLTKDEIKNLQLRLQ